MSNKKISELTAVTTTNSTDETVLAVSGASKKITMSNLINGIVKLITTSAKGMTGVDDSNGNEVVKFTGVDSAVNEVTITNAASGSDPSVTATGGDTNIDLNLSGKGTGRIIASNIKLPGADSSNGFVPKTNGSGEMNLAKVGSSGYATVSITTSAGATSSGTATITHNLGYIPSNITFSGVLVRVDGTTTIYSHSGQYNVSGSSSYVHLVSGSLDTNSYQTSGSHTAQISPFNITGIVQNVTATTFDIYLTAPIGAFGAFTYKGIFNCN